MENITVKKSYTLKTTPIKQLALYYRQKLAIDTTNLNRYQSSRYLFDSTIEPKKYLTYCDDITLNEQERFVFRVNLALSFLDETEKEIIWLDFFYIRPDRMKHWLQKYRRSTYYRLRGRAIDRFYLQCIPLFKEIGCL